uniref:C-type lectin domain-containing protein n=1 Tax=Globodera rostochiensis TaxID=31243 RepID=A0A914GQV0_GLORO
MLSQIIFTILIILQIYEANSNSFGGSDSVQETYGHEEQSRKKRQAPTNVTSSPATVLPSTNQTASSASAPFNLNNPSVAVCTGFGWTISGGNCYKVVEGLMDWNQAVAACRAEDPAASLASIDNEAENRLLGRMIARSIARSLQTYRLATTLFNTLWIGLRRVRAGAQYQSTWPNGTLATFGNVPEITTVESTTGGRNIYPWGIGQPSGTNKYTDPTGTNEECVHMFSVDGQWNDVGCEIQMTGAICQKSGQF